MKQFINIRISRLSRGKVAEKFPESLINLHKENVDRINVLQDEKNQVVEVNIWLKFVRCFVFFYVKFYDLKHELNLLRNGTIII